MQSTVAATLYATHFAETSKVKNMVQKIRKKGFYCLPPIKVRRVDGMLVIIDGVHRAVAACKMNVAINCNLVRENELLSDNDIRSRSLTMIGGVAGYCDC